MSLDKICDGNGNELGPRIVARAVAGAAFDAGSHSRCSGLMSRGHMVIGYVCTMSATRDNIRVATHLQLLAFEHVLHRGDSNLDAIHNPSSCPEPAR